MKCSVSISLLFLAAANSIQATPFEIESRAITGPTRAYTCDVNGSDKSFTAAYITKSITHAAETKATTDMLKELPNCDLSSTHARDLAFCQPKEYKNHAVAGVGTLHFPDCPTGPWYEFPLMTDGTSLYSGPKAAGSSNPVRVIFQYSSSTTAKFCGAVVHHSSVNGDFISCN